MRGRSGYPSGAANTRETAPHKLMSAMMGAENVTRCGGGTEDAHARRPPLLPSEAHLTFQLASLSAIHTLLQLY